MSENGASGRTADAVLGGRLRLEQPRRGHRFGHDAILLAAACPARKGERAVDLGAGVGAAGLALAKRIDGLMVMLVEVDAQLAALAMENVRRNGLALRVSTALLDVAAPARAFAAAGLHSGIRRTGADEPPVQRSGAAADVTRSSAPICPFASPRRARRLGKDSCSVAASTRNADHDLAGRRARRSPAFARTCVRRGCGASGALQDGGRRRSGSWCGQARRAGRRLRYCRACSSTTSLGGPLLERPRCCAMAQRCR